MHSWIFAASFAVVGSVALWALYRRRTELKREIQSLQCQHKELKSALHGFMEESEKIVAELSRIVTIDRPDATTRGSDSSSVSELPRLKPRFGLDRKHHVLSLARKGVTTNEIASQLMMSQGEIQLIVDLYRDRIEEPQSAGFA